MIAALALIVAIFAVIFAQTESCRTLSIKIDDRSLSFDRLSWIEHQQYLAKSDHVDSGRAIYASSEGYYLYHIQDEKSGTGYWVVSSTVASNIGSALYHIESWAVDPLFISNNADNTIRASWIITSTLQSNRDVEVSCLGRSDTVYFESSPSLQPQLTGFYTARELESRTNNIQLDTVYVQIKHQIHDRTMYLFPLPSSVECTSENDMEGAPTQNEQCQQITTWLIGEQYGVDAGLAYTIVTESVTSLEQPPSLPGQDAQWQFVNPGQPWTADAEARLVSLPTHNSLNEEKNVFKILHALRSVEKSFPADQTLKTLRNGLPVPQVGLGTGGVFLEDALDVFTDALSLGYRLFDLAREYGNEHIVPQALDRVKELHATQCALPHEERDLPDACNSAQSGERPVGREDLFLQTKVWPTELGYAPTTAAISTSLRLLQSNYIDLYMLHWPE